MGYSLFGARRAANAPEAKMAEIRRAESFVIVVTIEELV
jgi:hypothetical protein